ncbi:N-acetyltransferase [Nitratireductor sp. GISD-1A_MAKvit]|uniref:GNAT family N-acetyltransferase n=1 Tax=Nitratireductor sp. GISD-1A_MAKvit TaxID=3234198 RepID=UPI003465E69E
MNAMNIRTETVADRDAVHTLLCTAFDGDGEARLVQSLHADGDVVLSLVAETEGVVYGHVLFSRLNVVSGDTYFPAVALAPLAVSPARQRQGVAAQLVEEAHQRLIASGETLSVVLGDPAYYGRFGYRHGDAESFESDYQCEALQALRWDDVAPRMGKLVYAPAFGGL